MKRIFHQEVIVALLSSACMAFAQTESRDDSVAPAELPPVEGERFPPPGRPNFSPDSMQQPNMQGPSRRGMRGGGGGGGGGAPPIEMWLDMIKEKDPAEYEKLIALKNENPNAFYNNLRYRVKLERFKSDLQEHPKVMEVFDALSEEDRRWIVSKIQPPKKMQSPGAPQSRIASPEINTAEQTSIELTQKYHQTKDEKEKQKIKEDIRTQLNKTFDLREQKRAEELNTIQTHLQTLEQTVESRKANRDAIIEQRLHQLTEGDEWEW